MSGLYAGSQVYLFLVKPSLRVIPQRSAHFILEETVIAKPAFLRKPRTGLCWLKQSHSSTSIATAPPQNVKKIVDLNLTA
jgi:hypothetical protein